MKNFLTTIGHAIKDMERRNIEKPLKSMVCVNTIGKAGDFLTNSRLFLMMKAVFNAIISISILYDAKFYQLVSKLNDTD